MIRLQKFIALSGLCSRRKAEELISNGEIAVNGKNVSVMGIKVNPLSDVVTFRNKVIKAEAPEYYMLNKPTGYSSTLFDPHAEKTVLELICSSARLFPVGRLDRDSEGLLLITNDGDFFHRVIHPRHNIAKIYEVELVKPLTSSQIEKMKTGISLEGKEAKIVEIEAIDGRPNFYKIVIYQGRKRQIRRMIEYIHNHVVYLRRVQIGELKLNGLEIGKFRPLTQQEIDFF